MHATSNYKHTHALDTLRLSKHARSRMQQRGIKEADVCVALDYGKITYSKGDKIYALSRKSGAGLPAAVISACFLAERKKPLYIIVTSEGVVKTAGWRYRRLKNNFLRHNRTKRSRGRQK